ncbi:hypothetical protein L6164_020811 [Bauhinia variegata]|uniref:Uncharacterized protein n=1 Tax=Bauhinia variegata TaxID=167791 RepID=A0ACB9MXI6_BAUVA|nr:hypothetical protein L6164_020811 [Bauhinia variegata]
MLLIPALYGITLASPTVTLQSPFKLTMAQMLTKSSSFEPCLCFTILFWDIRIKGSVSLLSSYFDFLSSFASQKWKAAWTRTRNSTTPEPPLNQSLPCIQSQSSVTLTKYEVIRLVENLGLNVGLDGDGIEEVFGEQEISELFEKEPPSMDEVKDVFDVFDENKDGFIEARELQRVFCCLGLEKNLEECLRMIRAVDRNGDDLVDQDEFVEFMERGFSSDS